MNAATQLPEIRIPRCSKGIGDVILQKGAPSLIQGVVIDPVDVWPDDRGYFLEVGRFGVGTLAGFPAATTQISSALSYPGTIKAFHFHRRQTDVWVPMAGMFQVVLVDLRTRPEVNPSPLSLMMSQMASCRPAPVMALVG